ncbi:MAG: DUF2769 domain-containing protein [Chloroflexi bacterium]|nr:DUF2769 domain-containing protein [Chloroflexota bacterium]
MARVEFNMENVNKCQCPPCPVQAQSSCVKDKLAKLQQMMQPVSAGTPDPPPDPDIVPGMYCSTGTASCADLDFNKSCFCPTCAVWTESKLTARYYCEEGNADQIG